MKTNTKKFTLFSIIGTIMFITVAHTLLYDAFRKVKKNLFRDFYYWGEEFIDD